MNNNNQTSPKEGEKEEKISLISRLWGVIAYIWVFAFIPYFLKRKNEFVFFHAKQGVVIFVAEIIFILISAIPIIGQIIAILGLIFCAFLSIKGMIKSLTGKKWKMPILSRYTEKI
jgi:uncharacterized membrane protein